MYEVGTIRVVGEVWRRGYLMDRRHALIMIVGLLCNVACSATEHAGSAQGAAAQEEPCSTWVAPPGNVQKGSGTEKDPYHDLQLALSNAYQTADPSEQVVCLKPGTYTVRGDGDGGAIRISASLSLVGHGSVVLKGAAETAFIIDNSVA